jgi:hypothetical protein
MQLEEQFSRYAIKELAPGDAEKMLCHYAKVPAEVAKGSLSKTLQEMVQACAGLPLALRVMGAALRGIRNQRSWEVRLVVALLLQ